LSSPKLYTLSAEDIVRITKALRYKASRSIFKVLRRDVGQHLWDRP